MSEYEEIDECKYEKIELNENSLIMNKHEEISECE